MAPSSAPCSIACSVLPTPHAGAIGPRMPWHMGLTSPRFAGLCWFAWDFSDGLTGKGLLFMVYGISAGCVRPRNPRL